MKLALTPDGKYLAAALTDRSVVIVESSSGTQLCKFTLLGFGCEGLKFSGDGDMLLCTSGTGLFESKHWFDVWRLSDRRLMFSNRPDVGPKFPHAEELYQATDADLSPDGRTLLVCSGAAVYAIDLAKQTAALMDSLSSRGYAEVYFEPDGRRMLCLARSALHPDEDRLYVARTTTCEIEHSYDMAHKLLLAVRQDGRIIVGRLVPGSDGYDYEVIDVDTGKPLIRETLDPGSDVGFFRGDTRLMLLKDNHLRVWDLRSHTIAISVYVSNSAVATCADATLAMSDDEGIVSVWRLKDN
jgi:WD40 repeat protein